MKNDKVSPVGLKGNEVTERMKALMGVQPINESNNRSVVEITKMGPDGNVYAIVRENHKYFIKTTAKKSNMLTEDFNYIGGLQNKADESYSSYSKALKHLNIKFNSIAEALGGNHSINVFENDATAVGFQQYQGNGFTNEGNLEDNEPIEEECDEEEVELTEDEQAIDDMMKEDETEENTLKAPVTERREMTAGRVINEMDGIIDNLTKKKNYRLL